MAAHGFKPLRHLAGGEIRNSEYTIAIAYDTAIYTGDPVKLVAGGGIELAAAGQTTGLVIEPFDDGFRYTGTGGFANYP